MSSEEAIPFGEHILDFAPERINGEGPQWVFEAAADGWRLRGSHEGGSGAPWEALRQCLKEAQLRWPEGGAVGYFAYEAVRWMETSRGTPRPSPIPLIRLVFYKRLHRRPSPKPAGSAPALLHPPDSAVNLRVYREAVHKIQAYIAAGDIYQANLTEEFSPATQRKPEEIYDRLRALGPAPKSALLKWPDFAVVSNSPETFLTLRRGVLTSRPIKGTAPRGNTLEADEVLKEQLLNSAKDRAENVMIVDLLRNDLGRVCDYGSVTVPELCVLETLPTVHHLVSTVQGTVRADCSGLDAFLAAFPCGSITGAPKIRAMQILQELEDGPRGVSMGAIGYFGFDGTMDWSVAIRTAVVRDGVASFRAGGGIVADSRWESEYEEMRLKGRALWSAVG